MNTPRDGVNHRLELGHLDPDISVHTQDEAMRDTTVAVDEINVVKVLIHTVSELRAGVTPRQVVRNDSYYIPELPLAPRQRPVMIDHCR